MQVIKGLFYFLVSILIVVLMIILALIIGGLILVGPTILCIGLVVVLIWAGLKEYYGEDKSNK